MGNVTWAPPSRLCGGQCSAEAGGIRSCLARRAAASNAIGTGDRIHVAAMAGIPRQCLLHGKPLPDRRAGDGTSRIARSRRAAARTGELDFAVVGVADDHWAYRR